MKLAIPRLRRRSFVIGTAALLALPIAQPSFGQADPLPSWNDTAVKQAMVEFIKAVVEEGGAGFVPVEQRIAVFDMDGTLIPEQPLPAAAIPLIDGLKSAVKADPSLARKPAIAALLAKDKAALAAIGEEGVAEIIAAITADRTVEEAAKAITDLMANSDHPTLGRPYTKLGYQPMLELMDYLEANGFQTWICSGSPVLFTRQFSETMFGIPPQRVMGSSIQTSFAERNGKSVLVFGSAIEHINDKDGKPPTINLAIGSRPLFVGGNVRSFGDIAMMRYSKDRDGPSFQLLINHDDAEREFAYAEPGDVSLHSAKTYGFHVVSMRSDWRAIFSS
jgi:phosphoglycolate phosphatase-like HAD superfamily hydrolase